MTGALHRPQSREGSSASERIRRLDPGGRPPRRARPGRRGCPRRARPRRRCRASRPRAPPRPAPRRPARARAGRSRDRAWRRPSAAEVTTPSTSSSRPARPPASRQRAVPVAHDHEPAVRAAQRGERRRDVGEGGELERAEHRPRAVAWSRPGQLERLQHRPPRSGRAGRRHALAIGALEVVLEVVGDLGAERGGGALLGDLEARARRAARRSRGAGGCSSTSVPSASRSTAPAHAIQCQLANCAREQAQPDRGDAPPPARSRAAPRTRPRAT